MPAGKATLRRRRKVHALHEREDLGVRELARRFKVNPSTISRDLRAPKPDANGAPAPPELGNARATVVHGAYSEKRIGPLREKHMLELRATYEWVDDRRLAVVADAAARLESAAMFIDAKGAVVRGPDLSVWPVSDRADRWARSLWAMLSQLEAEALQRRDGGAGDALRRHLEANYSSEPDGDDAEALTAAGGPSS